LFKSRHAFSVVPEISMPRGNIDWINWKMSAKAILVQMHHKAAAFEELRKKLVLVLQRELFDYITKEFRISQLRDATPSNHIHFHVYDCVEMNNRLALMLASRKSTDIRGVIRRVEDTLNLGRESTISEADVIDKIKAKMPFARRLSSESK